MLTAAPPPPTDLKNTLEEMRASVAAQGTRKGIKGAIQEVILGFLSVLMALLEDLRAGRLARLMPESRSEAGTAVADGSEAVPEAGYPSPSRIGPHFCEQK